MTHQTAKDRLIQNLRDKNDHLERKCRRLQREVRTLQDYLKKQLSK